MSTCDVFPHCRLVSITRLPPLAYLFTLNLRSSAPAATARVRACVRSCVRDVHAASQKRPPRAETGKTSAAQSMSKAVRGPPIVERRGSIVPPIPSRPHHAASQKRPPRAETRKTGPAQSMSKAVRGLPIVERRGSIALGLRRAPGPFHHCFCLYFNSQNTLRWHPPVWAV